MNTMLILLSVGAATASTLWIGGFIGAFWKPPDWLIGILIAFASGALISALAVELFEGAVERGGILAASTGLAIGTMVFVVIDHLIDCYGEGGSGLGLLASITTDGIPGGLSARLTQFDTPILYSVLCPGFLSGTIVTGQPLP